MDFGLTTTYFALPVFAARCGGEKHRNRAAYVGTEALSTAFALWIFCVRRPKRRAALFTNAFNLGIIIEMGSRTIGWRCFACYLKRCLRLVAHGLGDYRYERVPTPRAEGGDIILEVEACGVCAGDIKCYEGGARFWGGGGNPAFVEPPFIPGHELLGRVAEVGPDLQKDRSRWGDRITSEQLVPCGKCRYCREGKYWLCDPHNVYGFKHHLNGGFAKYVRLPERARNYRVPEDLPVEKAILIEPFACSMHAVDRAKIEKDDVVVIAGAGTLGLGMVAAAREAFAAGLDLDRSGGLAARAGAQAGRDPRDGAVDEGRRRAADRGHDRRHRLRCVHRGQRPSVGGQPGAAADQKGRAFRGVQRVQRPGDGRLVADRRREGDRHLRRQPEPKLLRALHRRHRGRQAFQRAASSPTCCRSRNTKRRLN